MPVKIECSSRYSPTPFDCGPSTSLFDDDFYESSNIMNDVNGLEDIFNFIPTPPQSPPFKAEQNSMLMIDELKDFDHDSVISHDCMWSGSCSQEMCKAFSNKPISNSNFIRPETPFNLSTSPTSTFSYMSSYELNATENENAEDEAQTQPEQQQQQQPTQPSVVVQQQQSPSADCNAYAAMANDHSYGGSSSTQKFEIDKCVIPKTKKVCNDPYTRITGQGRITKMKCKKLTKISNMEVKQETVNILKSDNSVLKPTIISVSSFKNIKNSNFPKKYKLSIKKKKFLANAQVIHHGRPVMICKEENCSDSEESSLSYSSIDGDGKTMLHEPPMRRREHNDSERKRRDHLRNSFNNLRDQIPKLVQSQKRPPRIMILHEAALYANALQEENEELESEYNKEVAERNRLLKILKKLSKNNN